MNIFMLHNDPVIAAKMQCDKHVVKMIVESAQMLSTAHRLIDGVKSYEKNANGRRIARWHLEDKALDTLLYKASHVNHPSSVWCRAQIGNYIWLYRHFVALCDEYTYRYNKVHLTDEKLRWVLSKAPTNINMEYDLTPMPQAMDEQYKSNDPILAYRSYYQSKQSRFNMAWTKRERPQWFNVI